MQQNHGSVMIPNSTTDPAATFPPGAVVYLQPTPAATAEQYATYRHKQAVGLGAAQITLGCLCIVFNAVSLGVGFHDISFVGHGFWSGVLFIITGAMGMAAGMNKTRCKIIAYLVLCIISACFTVSLLVCGLLGSIFNRLSPYCSEYGYDYEYSYYYQSPCKSFQLIAAMEGCMAACGLTAAVLFIWASTLACIAKACGCYSCCRSCSCSSCSCCCCCWDLYPSQTVIDFTHGIPNNFQVLNASSYPLITMPYQQGMVAMSAPPPYPATFAQTNMVAGGWQPAMGEVMVTGVAQTSKE